MAIKYSIFSITHHNHKIYENISIDNLQLVLIQSKVNSHNKINLFMKAPWVMGNFPFLGIVTYNTANVYNSNNK